MSREPSLLSLSSFLKRANLDGRSEITIIEQSSSKNATKKSYAPCKTAHSGGISRTSSIFARSKDHVLAMGMRTRVKKREARWQPSKEGEEKAVLH